MTDRLSTTSSDSFAPTPRIIGDHDSHDAVRELLKGKIPSRILDVPAGEGALSKFLAELGWDVYSADIDRGNFKLQFDRFKEVNLNKNLTYDDNYFDAVLFINGIHRLYNPGAAVTEFYRILRPGGILYINVNNYASIDRRIRFLIYGSIADAVNKGVCEQTIDDPEAHVRIAMLYPQIANILEERGFKIIKVRAAAQRWRQTLLYPLAWMVRGLALLLPPSRRKSDHIDIVNSSAICPGGSYLLIEALKPSASAEDAGEGF